MNNHNIIEQASHWAMLYDEGELDSKQKVDLSNWLLKSPAHIEEFLHAGAIFNLLEGIDANKKISVDALIEKINQPTSAVIAFDSMQKKAPLGENSTKKKGFSNILLALAASVIISVCSLYGLHYFSLTNDTFANLKVPNQDRNQYTTVLGEQRSITLSDGTIVYLNTLTNIKIDYNEQYRNIHLNRGEAIFKVAHNPDKPFRVWVDGVMFQAVGTEFNVRDKQGKVELTVITGEVALTNQIVNNEKLDVEENTIRLSENTDLDLKSSKTLIVTIGQEASVQANGKITTDVNADLNKKTSWKLRQLIFKNDTLEDVIHEFNRYNQLQIVIESDLLSRLPITGIFESNDPSSLIEFLRSSGKVSIKKDNTNKVNLFLSQSNNI
mgnify:CR=1 FL=1